MTCNREDHKKDSDCSSLFYATVSPNITPPEIQCNDTEEGKDLDELSLHSNDCQQHNSDEESYELNSEPVIEISSFLLNCSGRIYSTIMEEPEEDNTSIPYIDGINSLQRIRMEVLTNKNAINDKNNDISSELCDSLIIPPTEVDMWRISGMSCITGLSSTTDCSDDTIAQNMSELSSVNSYLSDLAIFGDQFNEIDQLPEECDKIVEKNIPTVKPVLNRKNTNISHAISQLEDIELTAQNLLKNKHYKDNRGHHKKELSNIEMSDEKACTERNSEPKNKNYKKKKKSLKSREYDKEKQPVYWLKPGNIKPYISRESYNEDLADTPEGSMKRSFQESDLNDYLDQLDTVNENNEINGCILGDNINTSNSVQFSHTYPFSKTDEVLNEKQLKKKKCYVSRKKNSAEDIDYFLKIKDFYQINNNPDNFERFKNMENFINKAERKWNMNNNEAIKTAAKICENGTEDGKNTVNIMKNNTILEHSHEAQIDIPAILTRTPKVRKKGSKNKKSKKSDKALSKTTNPSLDNSFHLISDQKQNDSINGIQNDCQLNISSFQASNNVPVENKEMESNEKLMVLGDDNSYMKLHSSRNTRSNQLSNKIKENVLINNEFDMNKIAEFESQTACPIKNVSKDRLDNNYNKQEKLSYNKCNTASGNTDDTDRLQCATGTKMSMEEKDIIADISNNLWNNYCFDECNSLSFNDRFLPLPPIQEALSDDYSIPQTPETTSISLTNEQHNKMCSSFTISNKNEAILLESESVTTMETKVNKITEIVDTCKSKPEQEVITSFENRFYLDDEHQNKFEQSDETKNVLTFKNVSKADLYPHVLINFNAEINELTHYSDEMLKMTEDMEREFNSDELCDIQCNMNEEQYKGNRKHEKEKCDKNSYIARPESSIIPMKTGYRSNKLRNNGKDEFFLMPDRGILSINDTFNEHNNHVMIPRNKCPYSAPPIVYNSASQGIHNVIINDDKQIDLAVPNHYKEKMPLVVVNELKKILQGETSKEKEQRTLNGVCKKIDLALNGIDEPSLLDEIQQLLGFDVHQLQNVPETQVPQESARKQLHKNILTSHETLSHSESASPTSYKTKKIPAPIPPKRKTANDTISSESLRTHLHFLPNPTHSYEFQPKKPSTPPVPPKPYYIPEPERSNEIISTQTLHSLNTQKGGVWSPGTAPVDHIGPSRLDTPDLPSFKDIPQIWTPARGGSASPSSNKKEYRKITFDGPTVPKRAHQQDSRSVPRPEESFAWQGKGGELNTPESLHLPRAPNPTVTLLQKKREGVIQDHKAEYLKSDDSSYCKPGEKLYTIKKEYESEDEELGNRKFAVLGARKIEGVGPTTKEGMPTSLKTGVKSEHHGEWYRRMFDSLHKVKDESETKHSTSKVRYGGYTSEPGYDSDAGITRYAKYDRSKNEFEFDNGEPTTSRKTKRYVHQPGRIENYVPGFSSLSERELRENPESDVKLEISFPKPSQQTFQGGRRLGRGYKESGYDSDSTLVYKKREDTSRKIQDPREISEIYKEIQRGGDIPLSGLQRPAPRAKALPHNKYETSEVNIHYRTPIRVERKDFISDEELARRQEQHMTKVYEQERRKKYLSELDDIERRRHTDNFTPLQKSPIPLNRYDDEAYGAPRRFNTTESRQLAKTLFGFHAQNKRELNFSKGDIITIIRHIDKNWIEGELRGNVGIFPSNYVEMLPFENFKTVPRRSTEGQARVRFNFQAQTSMEMSLNKGEIITLTRRVDDNWFEGRVATRKGIFPVSYVDILQEPLGRDTSPVPDILSRPALPPAHLLFNGTSAGQHGSKSDTKAPFSQLTVNTQQEPISYRALYNYKPQNDDELELLEGDAVMVMEKCDDGWFVGTSQRTNLFGTFPGNYVEKI